MTQPLSTPVSVPLFVGIDVSLDKLDLGRTDSDKLPSFPNDLDGIRRLVEHLRALAPALIVVAGMRKLIALLNAMLRNHLSWEQLDLVKNLSSKESLNLAVDI